MLDIHAGTGAGDDFGDRFVSCFVQAADDAALPSDPAFRASLRAYMEWAVREVLSYSPSGSEVPPSMPVPHWSWSGLEENRPGPG
jgi:hemoglobin